MLRDEEKTPNKFDNNRRFVFSVNKDNSTTLNPTLYRTFGECREEAFEAARAVGAMHITMDSVYLSGTFTETYEVPPLSNSALTDAELATLVQKHEGK